MRSDVKHIAKCGKVSRLHCYKYCRPLKWEKCHYFDKPKKLIKENSGEKGE